MDRTILHCDLNSFYASVELLDRPDLVAKPVAVCGDPESRHGVILAKNDIAKSFDINTAETIWQARRKCPDLVLLPAFHHKYVHYSKLINEIYEQFTDLVEPYSIDESWLDVTGSMHLFGNDGKLIADQIRQKVQDETGLTISVGVSFNKIFAKLGSDMKKPNATTVITRSDVASKVWTLPATDMMFFGKSASKTLTKYGVRTIGDIVQFGREPLVSLMGKVGGTLYDNSAGLDFSPVQSAGIHAPPKSVGNSFTFPRDLVGYHDIQAGVRLITDSVAPRLRKLGLRCYTVQVSIRDPHFGQVSKQRRLDVPVCTSSELRTIAMELIGDVWDFQSPVRQLSVTGQHLVPEHDVVQQLSFFQPVSNTSLEKRQDLERAMDGIRSRFGSTSILSTSTLIDGIRPKKNRSGSIPFGPIRDDMDIPSP